MGQQPAHHAIWIREKPDGPHLRLPVERAPQPPRVAPCPGAAPGPPIAARAPTLTATPDPYRSVGSIMNERASILRRKAHAGQEGRRYDTKLWMRDLMEGAAYLPK